MGYRPTRLLAIAGAGLGLALSAAPAKASPEAEKVRALLDGLRGVQVPAKEDKAKFAELNARMDSAWTFINAHESTALPIVTEELEKAVNAKEPDYFFLLDMSFLLVQHRGGKAADLAVAAMARLDPAAGIVRANCVELFHLAMRVGASGVATGRYLEVIDHLYLHATDSVVFFEAPHYVELNPEDVRCMVYGVAGEPAAQHLATLLYQPGAKAKDVMPMLTSIGSEKYTPQVAVMMNSATDSDTIGACVSYLLEVGGPAGRQAILALDVSHCDAKTQESYRKIRPTAEEMDFSKMAKALEPLGNHKTSDARLQRIVDQMEKNNGADHELEPAPLVRSGLPTNALLEQMKRIRTRSFRRENNHVFEDLKITNFVINTLQFKVAKP